MVDYDAVTHEDLVNIREAILKEPVALERWPQVVDMIVPVQFDAWRIKKTLLGDKDSKYADAVLESLSAWHGHGNQRVDLLKFLHEHELNSLAVKIGELLDKGQYKDKNSNSKLLPVSNEEQVIAFCKSLANEYQTELNAALENTQEKFLPDDFFEALQTKLKCEVCEKYNNVNVSASFRILQQYQEYLNEKLDYLGSTFKKLNADRRAETLAAWNEALSRAREGYREEVRRMFQNCPPTTKLKEQMMNENITTETLEYFDKLVNVKQKELYGTFTQELQQSFSSIFSEEKASAARKRWESCIPIVRNQYDSEMRALLRERRALVCSERELNSFHALVSEKVRLGISEIANFKSHDLEFYVSALRIELGTRFDTFLMQNQTKRDEIIAGSAEWIQEGLAVCERHLNDCKYDTELIEKNLENFNTKVKIAREEAQAVIKMKTCHVHDDTLIAQVSNELNSSIDKLISSKLTELNLSTRMKVSQQTEQMKAAKTPEQVMNKDYEIPERISNASTANERENFPASLRLQPVTLMGTDDNVALSGPVLIGKWKQLQLIETTLIALFRHKPVEFAPGSELRDLMMRLYLARPNYIHEHAAAIRSHVCANVDAEAEDWTLIRDLVQQLGDKYHSPFNLNLFQEGTSRGPVFSLTIPRHGNHRSPASRSGLWLEVFTVQHLLELGMREQKLMFKRIPKGLVIIFNPREPRIGIIPNMVLNLSTLIQYSVGKKVVLNLSSVVCCSSESGSSGRDSSSCSYYKRHGHWYLWNGESSTEIPITQLERKLNEAEKHVLNQVPVKPDMPKWILDATLAVVYSE